MKSGDYIFSMMFHGLIVAVLLLFTFTLQHRAVETPKIFELVAGEGDNYAATEAPALGTPGGVKLAAAPLPAPTPPAPAPVETPLTAATPPPAPKAPNFVKDVTRIAKKREARLEAKYKAEEEKAAKEEAAKLARMSKADFDKLNKGKKEPAAAGTPKVAKIDAEGIAKGVVGGSTANKVGGAGGRALTSSGDELDRYYEMLKERLKGAFEAPPGVSDTLLAHIEVRIATDGTLSGARITKSSGSPEFDQAVLEAIRRTHMPERPDNKSETVSFDFTMREKDEG